MELKNKRPRVFSAKYSPAQRQKIRPFSGVSTQQCQKQQIVENVYNSHAFAHPRGTSAKIQNMPRYSVAFQEGEKFIPRNVSKQTKQKEQMAEQILILKQTINKLTQQLSHQKGKVETIRRKNSKYSKALTMEFQNEKQWGSHAVSNHLVSGIKAMYDNLKQKYEKKCKFCDELIAKVEVTNFLEMHFYIETLEKNNKDLSKKLESVVNSSLQFPVSTDAEKKAKTYYVAELKFENDTLSERINDLESLLKEKNVNNSDQDKKVSFLEKLMIEKDNNIHAFQRKIKQLSSQIKRLKENSQKIHEKYVEKSSQYDKDMEEYACKLSRAQQKHKIYLEDLTQMKDDKIYTLEKNLRQYQDIIMDLRKNIIQLNYQLQNIKEERLKETFKKRQQEKGVIKKSNTLIIQSIMKNSQTKELNNFPIKQEGPRQVQRANKRYCEEAVKKRRVQLSQIIEIAELIRYRMLAKKIPLEQFKNLFNKSSQKKYLDPQWSQEYINMEETIEIFARDPIGLSEEQALLMSRYIIEDVNEQHVYCDFANQNHREVVKSIIKALIQSYPVFEGSKIDEDYKKAIENYGQNLSNTLETLYSSGTIPKHKFQIILKSLGVEIPENLKEYFIGKMALKAEEMAELPYKTLF